MRAIQFAVSLFLIALSTRSVEASMIFATSVHSQAGTIDGDTQWTLGTPDDRFVYGQSDFFVQIHDGASVTVDFGSLVTSPGTLSIFTVDNELPAFADVEVSADGTSFTLLAAALSDTHGVITLPPPPHTFPYVDLAIATPFRYVRFTDLPGNDSFDLNAVGFTANAEVPEPASLTLLSLGALGLAGAARCRRQAV